MEHTRFVGLDIHKERISIAVAESGRSGTVEYLGEISNDPVAIGKLCERLGRSGKKLAFCYEAGPCGYGVHRQLTGIGHRCDVVAPSLIPTKPGDRVKTNRRDATMLARFHRAGELTPVWVPDADHEAMRDLIRLRGVVRQIVTRARQIFRDFCYGTAASTGAGQHGEWLTGVGCRPWPLNIPRSRLHFRTMSMRSWMRSGGLSASRSRYPTSFPNGTCALSLTPCRRCGVSR